MSSIHEQITAAYENYLKESESFDTKGVKAAAARARKALGEMGKLAKSRRAEIQEKKNSMEFKKIGVALFNSCNAFLLL